MTPPPAGLRLTIDNTSPLTIRAELGRLIHAFHAETVPVETERFALVLHDAQERLLAGLSGALSWEWLYVDALWVDASLRGQGVGRWLMERAEAQAVERGCHSAWLDTFQARTFYEAIGYSVFGALEDYPPGQTRVFMRKRLGCGQAVPTSPRA